MATRAATPTLTDPLDGILPIWTPSDAELKAAVEEVRADPRPSIPIDEAFASIRAHAARRRAGA